MLAKRLPGPWSRLILAQKPVLTVVGRGSRGHNVATTKVLISGNLEGLSPELVQLLQNFSAIEPESGLMKYDEHLARCTLKRPIGATIFAVLYGSSHNTRKIVPHTGL